MEVKASLKYLNISPRKTRLVANLIKGLSVSEAEAQLKYNKKRSSKPLLKLLKSAISNAENNFHLNKDNLFIKSIRVNEGPALKRYRPRARGAMFLIKKRTSHIDIVLAEKGFSKTEEKPVEIKKEIKKKQDKVVSDKEIKKNFERQEEEKIVKKVLPKQKVFRRKAI